MFSNQLQEIERTSSSGKKLGFNNHVLSNTIRACMLCKQTEKKEIDLYLSRPLAFPPLLLICTTLRKDQCRRTLLLCLSIPTYLKLPAHIHEYCLAILVNFGPWLERDERERGRTGILHHH